MRSAALNLFLFSTRCWPFRTNERHILFFVIRLFLFAARSAAGTLVAPNRPAASAVFVDNECWLGRPWVSMGGKLVYGLLCDEAKFADGKWSFLGVFNRIASSTFPFSYPRLVLCASISADPGRHDVRVQLVDSQDKPIGPEQVHPLEFVELQNTTFTVVMDRVPLRAQGFYAFRLRMDKDEAPFGRVEFAAVLQKP